MPLTAKHLRDLADLLEKEETEAQRELELTEDKQEREQLRKDLEELRAKQEQTAEQLERSEVPEPEPEPEPEPDEEEDEVGAKRRTRPGRKSGRLYQDERGGPGYIHTGPDEPDRVEFEIDEEAST